MIFSKTHLRLRASLIALSMAAATALPMQANALDTAATMALVLDSNTGAILLEKNAHTAMPPASMSKLMTVNMVFEALADGRLSLDDQFRVSEKAWRMGGSKMFLREGDRVSIENLLRGVIIASGNDATVVLAEGLAGSEEAFAERMTTRARELGMNDSHFANASGWPNPGQRMSANDLVFLANRIIHEFPQFYHYFSEESFEWEGVAQKNRNPLLTLGIGADGLKTGHTEEAGYGLVGSAVRDGRRVTFMIGGLPSAKDRAVEAERLTEWAYRDFAIETPYRAGDVLGEAEVWLGEAATVPVTIDQDVEVTRSYSAKGDITAKITYEGPIEAPISKGQKIGTLTVTVPDMGETEIPVVAAENVAEGGFMVRFKAAASNVIADLLGSEKAATSQ